MGTYTTHVKDEEANRVSFYLFFDDLIKMFQVEKTLDLFNLSDSDETEIDNATRNLIGEVRINV